MPQEGSGGRHTFGDARPTRRRRRISLGTERRSNTWRLGAALRTRGVSLALDPTPRGRETLTMTTATPWLPTDEQNARCFGYLIAIEH